MAYRKTELVLAGMESRKSNIMTATIGIISESGIQTLTTDAVAERAEVSVGLIYKYFPNMTELLASVTAQFLTGDLEAMQRKAASSAKGQPGPALVASLLVLYGRLAQAKPLLVRAMHDQPVYRNGMRSALEKMIRAAEVLDTPKERTLAAAATLGALIAQSDVGGAPKRHASEAVLFALRGIGFQDAWSRKAVARYSLVTA